MDKLSKNDIIVLVALVLFFIWGFLFAKALAQEPKFEAEFKVVVEQGYGGSDGIRFINLSSPEKATLDRLTCSADADLPLAKYLLTKDADIVRITIEEVEPRELQKQYILGL